MRKSLAGVLFYGWLPASAQHDLSYNFRHLDRTNGLLHNVVTAIAQDKKGYIWIGTVKGLQRYDGLRFKNYNDDQDSVVFQSAVQTIFAADTSLWITSAPETQKLDLKANRITRHFNPGESTTEGGPQYQTYTDRDGNKYLANDVELYKYNFKNRKMVLSVISLPLPSTTSLGMKDSANSRVWFVSPQGLLLADHRTKQLYSAAHNEIGDPLLVAMKGKSAAGIMMDSRHNIWINSRYNDQLYKYDPVAKKLSIYSLANIKKAQGEQMSESVLYNNCVFEDDHANIWVATQQAGLLKYNRQQDNFDYVLSANGNNQSIEYNYNINCIFQDNQGNIWVGTDKGINVFNPYKNDFQTIEHQKANAASLPQHDVLGFIQVPSGDILIATWGGGISIYDSALNFKKNLTIPGRFELNMVWCLIQKDENTVWAGCQHGFLHTYDIATESVKTIHPAAFENSTIRCMQKDSKGNIWFGLHNGKMAKWDKLSGKFEVRTDSAGGPDSAGGLGGPSTPGTPLSPVQHIFIDNHNNFWISTGEGLKSFDPDRGMYTATYPAATGNKVPPSANGIQGLEQYNDSILLTGTSNDGLYLFNLRTKSFTHAAAADGLPTGPVYAVKKNGADIWLTTDYNLYNFHPGKGSTAYSIGPDLINSSFESLQFYPLRDGRWITNTSAEAFLFNPDSLARKNEKPAVTITGFKLFDHPIFIDSLLDAARPISLTYRQNFLTIEYSALAFLGTQRARYHYRLSGIDKDWVIADGRGFASYTNLRPGRYIFSVKASDADNAPVTTITIIISPPWYNEWWFMLICVAVGAFLILRSVKIREKSVRKRALERANAAAIIQETQMQLDRQQYKMAEAEMNALRAQMNPHFLFNSLNSINNYILKNDADNAAGYLTKFSRLMRLILDNSRSNWIWLQNELKALQLYIELEAFRFDNSFTHELTIAADVNSGLVMVPPMIIQPYIENAIWHGLMHRKNGGGHLQIDIYKEKENLCITIKDNGVGREAAARMRSRYADNRKSYGMKITAERLEIMNKIYNIDANVLVNDAAGPGGEATGTIVSIRFRYTLKNELNYDSSYSR